MIISIAKTVKLVIIRKKYDFSSNLFHIHVKVGNLYDFVRCGIHNQLKSLSIRNISNSGVLHFQAKEDKFTEIFAQKRVNFAYKMLKVLICFKTAMT